MAEDLKILLMRHAKSSWSDSSLSDFDRPLNNRGNRDAPAMGAFLKKKGLLPDLIISSPAARAQATTLHVISALGLGENCVSWDENLYFNGAMAYIEAFKSAGKSMKLVMTVGHNPMTESAIAALSEKPFHMAVSTAAVACLAVNAETLSAIQPGCCKFLWMMRPKDL